MQALRYAQLSKAAPILICSRDQNLSRISWASLVAVLELLKRWKRMLKRGLAVVSAPLTQSVPELFTLMHFHDDRASE